MSLEILKVVGMVLFLYLTWRNLRENYRDSDLISYAWKALVAFVLGGRIVYGLINWGIWNENISDWFLVWQKPGMNYEGAYLALVGITVLVSIKSNWKVWTFFEQLTNSILMLMLGMVGSEFVGSRFELSLGMVMLLIIICIMLSAVIRKKYRSFAWYKSGKSGFVWFFINFVFWAILTVIALLFWNNEVRSFLYILLSLTSLAGLFILGEVVEPLLIFGKRNKQYGNH